MLHVSVFGSQGVVFNDDLWPGSVLMYVYVAHICRDLRERQPEQLSTMRDTREARPAARVLIKHKLRRKVFFLQMCASYQMKYEDLWNTVQLHVQD